MKINKYIKQILKEEQAEEHIEEKAKEEHVVKEKKEVKHAAAGKKKHVDHAKKPASKKPNSKK